MQQQDDIWGVMAFPWKRGNRLKYSVLIFAFVDTLFSTFGAVMLVQGSRLWLWFILLGGLGGAVMGLAFFLVYSGIGARLERKRDSAPKGARLEAEGISLDGLVESPAIIQLLNGTLAITPLAGQPVGVQLTDITGFQEKHWANGSQYWGDNAFFSLDVRGRKGLKGRLGFGVSRPSKWRRELSNRYGRMHTGEIST